MYSYIGTIISSDAYAWAGKSNSLWAMGRYEEATYCYFKVSSHMCVYFTPYTPNYNYGSDLIITNNAGNPIQVLWLKHNSFIPVFLVYVENGETCNVKIPADTYTEHVTTYSSTSTMKSLKSGSTTGVIELLEFGTIIPSDSKYSVKYYIKTETASGLPWI